MLWLNRLSGGAIASFGMVMMGRAIPVPGGVANGMA
jgi:hypothetical protein